MPPHVQVPSLPSIAELAAEIDRPAARMPQTAPRQAMIDEALRRAPAWAQQHLLVAVLDPDPECERCKAALAAVRAAWRDLLLERRAEGPAAGVSVAYPKSARPVRSSI